MNEGFFSKKETESKSRPNGKVLSCLSCGLYKDAKSPKMQPHGNFKKKIMVVGDYPLDVDDENGQPFSSKEGRLLQRTFTKLGVDLFEDCISINAVSCMPVDVDGDVCEPSNFELDNCRKIVKRHIDKYQPVLIILLGNSALYSLIGDRWKSDLGKIEKWRGWAIPDQDYQTWICPTYSPTVIQKLIDKEKDVPIEELIWQQDLQKAFETALKTFPVYVDPVIEITDDLAFFKNPKFGHSEKYAMPQTAFDYETTGLKPHASGHKIICAAVADSENHAYVFMMPISRAERKPFTDYLINPNIAKVAQNMKFEHAWSRVRLGAEVKGWAWDTMLATHTLDNRSEITGLKFQTYVQFGVIDYSSEVAPYLKAVDEKNANSINRIEELLKIEGGKEKLLRYCGYDAVYEYRLSILQRDLILPKI